MSPGGQVDVPGRRSSGQLGRSVRAIWWGWRAEFSGAAEYRVDLVSGTLVSGLWLGIAVAPMLVVSAHGPVMQGWTLPRLLFLSAIWYLLDAVLWMVIVTNHRRLEHEIKHGTLDVVLLRPVNSLLLCTLGTIYVQDTPKAVLALGLAAGAVVVGGGPPSVLAAVATAVAVACACVLLWAAGVLVTYKALTHVRFDATFALAAVHNLGSRAHPALRSGAAPGDDGGRAGHLPDHRSGTAVLRHPEPVVGTRLGGLDRHDGRRDVPPVARRATPLHRLDGLRCSSSARQMIKAVGHTKRSP